MKYGLAAGWIKCPECGKKFFKPAGATVKKCDFCGAKYKFIEKITQKETKPIILRRLN